ncbi:alpha-glucosidase/alpha-galactosidase [Deinococcus irradiatisoli]|uniref:Alpha-glucosidase/alpha-galactosidase n=1 Tax=Deinococcus irradiatisoli TaxID=2202254 RepID=A0A2Z3JA54_9DEIO|nr:alpha-glucosidase/alpha-galactosidase [Deinococcus irradiatisoli]AWN21963.1 alpha-glucosidase/alpha-galactosidase [Deinococcus irradiatisoli]
MFKIAIIGAGGQVFPLRLAADILSFPALQHCTLSLMDINPERLKVTEENVRRLSAHHQLPAQIEATTDQREALAGADAVIVTFQVGGLEAYRLDVEIPRRYGLDQPVGDTLGPGGVMRFLRSVPAYRQLAEDMLELCPDALLINYANPMAMSCWYLSKLGVHTVGLCHSVQGTTHLLARQLGIPPQELRYRSAGINHQAWLLELRHHGEDVYPRLRQLMRERHLERRPELSVAGDRGYHSEPSGEINTYEGSQERVRTSIMDFFGYFHTESSHHASEYLPYFRKNAERVEEFLPRRWDYYQVCCHQEGDDQHELLERLLDDLRPSAEYGAAILNALVTNEPTVIYGNVPNAGLISNLPEGCCVEVACLVDAGGVQPTAQGALPPQLAALNRSNVAVQELAVEAALSGDVRHVYHAVALDPLTSALLTLEQIQAMTSELLEAQAEWLPQFAAGAK